MSGTLKSGSIIWGWRYFRTLQPGKIVIFEHDGLEKIKRIEAKAAHKLYVVGDNKPASTDSRKFGWIDKKAVLAKVFWPRN